MGRKSKYFIVNITTVIILVLTLVLSFNMTVLAQESPTATPEILETATPLVVPTDLVGTEIPAIESLTLIPTVVPFSIQTGTPTIEVSPLSMEAPSITGRFSIIWGDSKGPAEIKPETRYILTQETGVSINLVLNDPIVGLEGGVLSLNRKYVTVTGIWADVSAQGGNPDFHVTGITLVPSQKKSVKLRM